jgi:hypothetical protein
MAMFLGFFFFAALHSGSAQPKQLVDQVVISREEVFPNGLYLVRAEARTAKSLRILHVYVGPQELKSREFAGDFDRPVLRGMLLGQLPPISGRDSATRNPLKPGDIGIFWVTENKASGRLDLKVPGLNSTSLTGFVLTDYRFFAHELALAKVLETIYRETDEGRLRRIDSYVKSEDMGKARVALFQLTRNARNPRLSEYLVELSREATLVILVQIEIHDALRKVKKDWAGSPGDLKMVRRWFTAPWKEADRPRYNLDNPWAGSEEDNLVRWLRAAAIHKSYSCVQQAEMVINGLANPHRTSKFKDELLRAMGPFLSQRTNGDAFAYSTKMVMDGPKPAEKFAAVRLLKVFAPFDEARRGQLRTLVSGQTDNQLSREIQSLLGDD